MCGPDKIQESYRPRKQYALRQGATHSHWSPIKQYAAKARRREGREVWSVRWVSGRQSKFVHSSGSLAAMAGRC